MSNRLPDEYRMPTVVKDGVCTVCGRPEYKAGLCRQHYKLVAHYNEYWSKPSSAYHNSSNVGALLYAIRHYDGNVDDWG